MPFDGRTIETHPDILAVDRAADALRRYGWIQGDDGDMTTGFCLMGAALYAGSEFFDRHEDVADEILHRRDATSVPQYNDLPGMTRAHALRFLRAFRMALMKKLLLATPPS